MKGKIGLACFCIILVVILAPNVNRLSSTPPGTDHSGSNDNGGNKTRTTPAPPIFTALRGTVNWPWHPVAKNGSYTITFTASTSQVYAVGLVFTPSPYPNNSNYWWAYSVRVQSNLTYTIAAHNSTYSWTPSQPTVTPVGATFEDDVYFP